MAVSAQPHAQSGVEQYGPEGDTAAAFATYATPGHCVQAAIRLHQLHWRGKRQDTVRYAPATDSVPPGVRQSVRTCADRFNAAMVPPSELLNLFQLYLWTQQEDLARMTITRMTSSQTFSSEVERGWQLRGIVERALRSHPARVDIAQRYLGQLDSMGASVATWRLFAHTRMSRYALSINNIPLAIAEARAAIRAADEMTAADRVDWVQPIIEAYDALAEPVSLEAGGAAALAVFDTALSIVGRMQPHPMGASDYVRRLRMPYALLGTSARPLQATYWYKPRASTSGGIDGNTDMSAHPRAGVVTLVVSVYAGCGGDCFPMYATLRRLHQQFGSAGLQIVLTGTTQGFFRNRLQPNPSTEAEQSQGYFQDFLKLPGVIAFDSAQFTYLPDGRRMNARTVNQDNYFVGKDGVVVGKNGTIQAVFNVTPEREQSLASSIESALRSSP